MKASKMATCLAALCTLYGIGAYAATWVNTSGTSSVNWRSSSCDPGWDVVYPDGQGAVAIFPAASKKNSVVVEGADGIRLGSLILDAGTQNADFQIQNPSGTAAPIPALTFDQDGDGSGYAVISNTSKRARVNLGSSYTVNLADDLLLVNRGDESYSRTFAISITGTITGSGKLIVDSDQNYTNGCVAISSSSSSFVGETHVVSGCLKVQNNKPFGDFSNVVRLGKTGGPEAKILLDGSAPTISNPIVVESGASGELSLGVVVVNAATFKSTFAGALTLNGPVSFDVPLCFVKNGTSYYGTNVVSGAISGAGRLTKKKDGVLKIESASNVWTGGTTVSDGTLVVAAGSSLGSGDVEVSRGATLELLGSDAISDSANLAIGDDGSAVGVICVPDGTTEVVARISVGGKLVSKGTYAALDSSAGGAVVKVPWISGTGLVRALDGKSGMAIIIR